MTLKNKIFDNAIKVIQRQKFMTLLSGHSSSLNSVYTRRNDIIGPIKNMVLYKCINTINSISFNMHKSIGKITN
jgi:hypothetical protein